MFLIALLVCLGIALLVNGGYTLFTFMSTRRGITHSRSEYIPTVTLLICAYNEEAVIAKKVENVARTNYLKEKLQVMFVNDHSSDRTREILDAEIRKIPFTTVVLDNEHDRSKPNALNFAFY